MVPTWNFHSCKLLWSYYWPPKLEKIEKPVLGPNRPRFSGWSGDGSKPLKLGCVKNFWTFGKSKRISIFITTYWDIRHRKKGLFSQNRSFLVHNSGIGFFPDMRLSTKWAHYYPLTMSRISRKSLEPFSRKIGNQPTNYNRLPISGTRTGPKKSVPLIRSTTYPISA